MNCRLVVNWKLMVMMMRDQGCIVTNCCEICTFSQKRFLFKMVWLPKFFLRRNCQKLVIPQVRIWISIFYWGFQDWMWVINSHLFDHTKVNCIHVAWHVTSETRYLTTCCRWRRITTGANCWLEKLCHFFLSKLSLVLKMMSYHCLIDWLNEIFRCLKQEIGTNFKTVFFTFIISIMIS